VGFGGQAIQLEHSRDHIRVSSSMPDDTDVICAKTANKSRCHFGYGLVWAQGSIIRWGPTTLCHELCKNGWSDQFAVWVVDSCALKEAKFNRIRQVVPMCRHGRAHWHNLVNTTKPYVCVSDAALCQITLTTCYY